MGSQYKLYEKSGERIEVDIGSPLDGGEYRLCIRWRYRDPRKLPFEKETQPLTVKDVDQMISSLQYIRNKMVDERISRLEKQLEKLGSTKLPI